MQATERNQGQRQWQLQPQAMSTPQSVVSDNYRIQWFGQSDMIRLVSSTGRLLVLYLWNRRPFVSGSNLERVGYSTQHVAKALAEAPHWQTIEKYWNTPVQQNNIWSIASEACTKQIFQEVYWSNGSCWIMQTQTATRFEHKLLLLHPIVFDRPWTT